LSRTKRSECNAEIENRFHNPVGSAAIEIFDSRQKFANPTSVGVLRLTWSSTLSEDRVVLVNKLEEDYVVTLKQKKAADKCAVFTTNR